MVYDNTISSTADTSEFPLEKFHELSSKLLSEGKAKVDRFSFQYHSSCKNTKARITARFQLSKKSH